jgi:metallo-beta-lactamase class B
VWALTTSDGIILLNAGKEYAVDAVAEGLQKMGLNPADVKYVVIHSGHDMQYGAARLFQERYHSRIMVSEADWNLIEKTTSYPSQLKPRRDMVIKDGQKLTLGDTTLTFYMTPGNTSGTISTILPLREGNQRHVGILMGGRNTNFSEGGVSYFSGEEEAMRAWKTSVDRLKDIVAKAGVDVFLTIRSLYDQENDKVKALKVRKPGDPHPYVSKNVVSRYLTTISECMDAQFAWRAAR